MVHLAQHVQSPSDFYLLWSKNVITTLPVVYNTLQDFMLDPKQQMVIM